MIDIRLLGGVEIKAESGAVALPTSKKAKGLLAFLAVTAAPHRRERLCTLFWDSVDDPRGSLRWSISKLRAAGEAGIPLIVGDRDMISLNPAAARVDLLEIRRLIADGLDTASLDKLRQTVELFAGPFLEGNDLPDCGEFQSWCVGERETARLQHVQVLTACIWRFATAPEEALAYARTLTQIDPDTAKSWELLLRLLLRLERRMEAKEQIDAGMRCLKDLPDQSLLLSSAWREMQQNGPRSKPEVKSALSPLALRQEIRFCRTEDNVRIAYASVGSGKPLMKTANWMTHLEYDLKSPVWRHWIRELSRDHQLIRYDERANGLSDWDVADFGRETFINDLAAVMDAAGVKRAPLMGISHGCAVAIAYTVAHPARVSCLILYGGYARGWAMRGRPDDTIRRQALAQLIEHGWGQDNPAFRQVFTTLFFPDASPEQMLAFNELLRTTIAPGNAARLNEAFGFLTVEHLLPLIQVPTLVLHCRDDGAVPFDEGRLMASNIAGARLVALEGRNHILLEYEPAWARFLAEVRDFLADAD